MSEFKSQHLTWVGCWTYSHIVKEAKKQNLLQSKLEFPYVLFFDTAIPWLTKREFELAPKGLTSQWICEKLYVLPTFCLDTILSPVLFFFPTVHFLKGENGLWSIAHKNCQRKSLDINPLYYCCLCVHLKTRENALERSLDQYAKWRCNDLWFHIALIECLALDADIIATRVRHHSPELVFIYRIRFSTIRAFYFPKWLFGAHSIQI